MSTFTCNTCGSSGSLAWMGKHPCNENKQIAEQGGRCEDYPCCGHTDGDGCATLESHTSDFWRGNPHLLCDHENGSCEVDYDGEDVDPELCTHPDWDNIDERAGTLECHACETKGVIFSVMGETVVIIGDVRMTSLWKPDLILA